MNEPSVDHPAVAAVRERLANTGHIVSVVRFLQRPGVAAVIALETNTNAEGTQTTHWPVIVEEIDGRWVVPDSVGGHRSQRAWPRARQALTAQPPKLMWDHMASSGPPGPHGERPAESWTVVIGRAARDARVFTVVSDLETRSHEVGEDGLAAVLFRKSWENRPLLRMQIDSGEVVALFNGEPGTPA